MDLYREEVMEHYENPRNMGEMADPDHEGRDSNASCGDMIQFQLKIKDGKISVARWKGIGCAISTAAASKLSEWLVGKKLEDIRKLNDEEIIKEGIGFTVNPGRMKCLLLPVRVVKKILEN
jgi:nitrogen fixation protein NifU and related proteins